MTMANRSERTSPIQINAEGTHRMQKHKKQHRGDVDSEPPKTGMIRRGCVKVGLPVKGVSSGRVGS